MRPNLQSILLYLASLMGCAQDPVENTPKPQRRLAVVEDVLRISDHAERVVVQQVNPSKIGVRKGTVSQVDLNLDAEFLAVGFLSSPDIGIFCTATLIRADLVLTASHCLQNLKPSEVVFGLSPEWSKRTRVTTERFLVPVFESGELVTDLAIIKLSRDFFENLTQFQPASTNLSSLTNRAQITGISGTRVRNGDEAVIVGFGVDEAGEGGIRRQGRVAIQPTANDAKGREFIKVRPIAGVDQIACAGDSGGPLLTRRELEPKDYRVMEVRQSNGESWVVDGVVSFGQAKTKSEDRGEFCDKTVSVLYVPTAAYIGVIKQLIEAAQ